MKNPPFITDGFYHIYNRGVEKRIIYLDRWDYLRYLETLDFYRIFPQPKKLSDYRRGSMNLSKLQNQKEIVKILCFCLMPNHFHLLIKQTSVNGITNFMKNTTNSYTRYFNTKYNRVGSLFQGSFKAKYIENDEYLLQLSKYIHRNSFPLKMWEGKLYPYSSYRNYIYGENHPFCDINFILNYFSQTYPERDYQNFTEETENINPEVYNSLIDPDD